MRDPHPEFPQPPSTGVALWRYMNADRFEWLVNERRLYIPHVAHLGDPWEGTAPQGQAAWWQQAIDKAASEAERQTLEHNRRVIGRFAKTFRENYYVSCWHMNEHENHAMWSCYTTDPGSVAIQTTYQALDACLPQYAFLGMVRYIDYSLVKAPSMNLFEFIMHKDTYFSFEQEVRAIVTPPYDEPHLSQFKANHFAVADTSGVFCFAPHVDLPALVKGVVLNPKASEEAGEHISRLCAENGLPTPRRSRRTQNLGGWLESAL